jgi:hypothetical protein
MRSFWAAETDALEHCSKPVTLGTLADLNHFAARADHCDAAS